MEWYTSLLQAFLPYGANMLIDDNGAAVIRVADIDDDGEDEIIGAYKWYGKGYLLILKHFNQGWSVIAHLHGRGYDISYLHVAPVTRRGRVNIIAGWQVGEMWSELAIYEQTRDGIHEITKPAIYFTYIEAEDMPAQDGRYEIALWSHDAEEAYQVEIYSWRNHRLEQAIDMYPYYFHKVQAYYEQKTKEMPNEAYYRYYLADAQMKLNQPDEAIQSIHTALRLDVSASLKEALLKLKERILTVRASYLYRASIQTTEGEKWGYIDDAGGFVLPPQYDGAFRFQTNGLASVKVGEVFGIINMSGAYVVEPKYGTIPEFSEGRAAVADNHGFHVIDERGYVLTNKPYSYIGDYQEGRAICANTNEQGAYLYGYLDEEGKEVIPPSYESAENFKDGKAVVKVRDLEYALIGRNGERLQTYPYAFVGDRGEGIAAFRETPESRYGFMDEAGHIVIQPSYTGAQPFQEGRAVVNTAEDYGSKFGLIDRTGRFIIEPVYHDIRPLGENRIAVGKAIDEKQPFMGSRYAIADITGLFLTDFVYYDVSHYENGLASVYDDTHTFFIGTNGRAAMNLPILTGSGTVQMVETLIEAKVDHRLSYWNRFGDVIWQESSTIQLNDTYTVKEEKYKPNRNYLVYYPKVEGMSNQAQEDIVNRELARLSQVKPIGGGAQQFSYTGDFSLSMFQKHLLVLELNGYEYHFGAAHGMPTKVYVHMNLENGGLYQLQDLFLPHSNYVNILSEIIRKQIETDSQYSYVFPDSYKGIEANQPFYVTDKALYIYFAPYEIAPFVAGFPTFSIPYLRIRNIINTNGEFWRAFH